MSYRDDADRVLRFLDRLLSPSLSNGHVLYIDGGRNLPDEASKYSQLTCKHVVALRDYCRIDDVTTRQEIT